MRGEVFVAGHRGLVGSAILRALGGRALVRTRAELDLFDGPSVLHFFRTQRIDTVYLAAATVGGIGANQLRRWEFLYQNLLIETNVLGAALQTEVRRVVFFGSSCIYPRNAPQPIREDALLTGPLEVTNEPYAIAKIAGLKLVEAATLQYGRAWVSLMPTNLYGPADNFDPEMSHVLPAMMYKFDAAKRSDGSGRRTVSLWGTGVARREFLHVDDLARAAVFVGERDATGVFNVGYGSDVSVRELAGIVATEIGFDGQVEWDATKPDGTPRKLLDSTRIRQLGWVPQIDLATGIANTYDWYLKNRREMP